MIANAARTGELPPDNGAPRFLSHGLVSLGTTALAAYELVGDKQKRAPDRIIPPAVVVRSLNAAFAGMALAPRRQRFAAAALAGATAVIASYVTFAARTRAMRAYGRVATGFAEDAIVAATALAALHAPLPEPAEL
jgi:uncharacterized membrane protein